MYLQQQYWFLMTYIIRNWNVWKILILFEFCSLFAAIIEGVAFAILKSLRAPSLGATLHMARRIIFCLDSGQLRQAEIGPAEARRYLHDLTDYILEIYGFQALKWCITCLCSFSFKFFVSIIWGVKKPSTRPLKDWNSCFRGSEYILYEILELRA